MNVEHAHERDYDELMEVIIRSFRSDTPDHPRFEVFLPDLYRRCEEDMNRHVVIREAGRIISAVGVYPMEVRCDGVALTMAGVGAVCTLPAHRGRGCMSLLLKTIRREMARNGYGLSWLSGLRERYGRYGWEKAGSDLQFSIEGRVEPSPAGWAINRVDVEHAPLDRINEVRGRLRFAGRCEADILRLKLRRYGMETWEASAGAGCAYVVLNRWKKWIAEWGGAVEGVAAILGQQLHGGETWSVRIPSVADEYTDLFTRLGREVACEQDNLAVVDLAHLAGSYRPVLQARWPRGRAVKLVVEDGLCASEVCLRDGEAVADQPAEAVTLTLGARQMALLLFGPERPSRAAALPEGLKWLDDILPLPFYTPSLWRV